MTISTIEQADQRLRHPSLARRVRFPLLIFAGTQLLATVFMLFAAHGQGQTYFEFVSRWDGAYYLDIARHGYTRDILVDGALANRNWAFYPLYPLLVSSCATLTGVDTAVMAPFVSWTAAAVGIVMMHVMVTRHLDAWHAKVATLLVSTAAAAPVFQMAYAEGLAFLLLLVAFDMLLRQRFGFLVVVITLLALCRPICLPFAAVITTHGLVRWNRSQGGERLKLAALAAYSAALSGLWPLVSGLATGVPDVYLRTMALWERADVGRSWFLQTVGHPLGWVLLVLMATVPLWLAVRFLPDHAPLEFRAWIPLYSTFIVFAAYPSSSTLRYLLLMWPVALVPAKLGRHATWLTWVIAAMGLVTQYLWIRYLVASSSNLFP